MECDESAAVISKVVRCTNLYGLRTYQELVESQREYQVHRRERRSAGGFMNLEEREPTSEEKK